MVTIETFIASGGHDHKNKFGLANVEPGKIDQTNFATHQYQSLHTQRSKLYILVYSSHR